MEQLGDLYESFRRIPFYLELMAVFTVLQFFVLAALGVVVAIQLHRIAETFDRSVPKNNDSHYPAPPPPYRPY